jgi:hypothetical protein
MLADVLPPPTFCLDWYMVGFPGSIIALLAVVASLVALFLVLKRPGRMVRNIVLLALCIVLFVAIDFAVYLLGCRYQGNWRTPNYPRRQFEVFDPASK